MHFFEGDVGHSPYYEVPVEYNAHLSQYLEKTVTQRPSLGVKKEAATQRGLLSQAKARMPLVLVTAAASSVLTLLMCRSRLCPGYTRASSYCAPRTQETHSTSKFRVS